MSIKSFYSKSNWRNLFGKKGPEYPTYHHGHDIAAAGRTPVPALRSGTVVALNKSSVVGFYVIVQVGAEDFDIYCHVINHRVTKGQKVKAGQTLTEVATWGDFTGSAWTGPHLHLANEPWAVVGTAKARDPRPLIEKALQNDQEDDMPAAGKVNKRIGTATAEWSLIRPDIIGPSALERGYIMTTDEARAKEWERAYAKGKNSADELSRDDYVAAQEEARRVHAAWLAAQRLVGGSGGTDLAPVLAAIQAGDAKLLAAIQQVDEETLKTFGLKRA